MRHLSFKAAHTSFGVGAVLLCVVSLFYMVPHNALLGRFQKVPTMKQVTPVSSAQEIVFESPATFSSLSESVLEEAMLENSFGKASWTPPLFRPQNTREMVDLFISHEFCLRKLKQGKTCVPRVFVSHFPADWKDPKTEKTRHQFFVQMVLPLVLAENERLLYLRDRAIDLFQQIHQGKTLKNHERTWLRKLAAEYKVPAFDEGALLARLDAVPPSLALAQAILESGFGRSQAAMTKNSIFGHMQTTTEVRPYPTLHHSVVSYIHNLNKHRAYRSLHRMRHQQRRAGQIPSGFSLTRGLMAYSERGKDYIRDLQYLIQRYRLERFDTVTLRPL